MKVLERKQWANPEEVDGFIEHITSMAKERGFLSLTCVGELSNGQIYTGSSRTEDKFKIAGALMFFAMKLMGLKEE